MTLQFINKRTVLVVHVVDVETRVLGARAYKAFTLLLVIPSRFGTEHGADLIARLPDRHPLRQGSRVVVIIDLVEEQMIGHGVHQQTRLLHAHVLVAHTRYGVAGIVGHLACLAQLEREYVKVKGGYAALVVARPQVEPARVEADREHARVYLLQAVLIRQNARR